MKVLHVCSTANFGGIEKLTYDLTKALSNNKNVSVELLVLNGKGDFLKQFKELNFPCHFSSISGGYDLSFWKYFKLYALLKKYDVVNLHSFNLLFSAMLFFVNAKIVYTMHSVQGEGRIKRKLGGLKRSLQLIFLNKFVDYITFNSNYTLDYWSPYLTNQNAKVVYNGVDLSSISSELSSPEGFEHSNKFIIGTSSRLVAWKRVDLLIDVFAQVLRNTDNDILLLIVGDGPEMDNLIALADSLNISEKVVFTGYKKNVRDYQNCMDLCVFPSTTETFGLVAIETLLLGKPTVVLNDGGGIAEIVGKAFPHDVVNGKAGLLERGLFYVNDYKTDQFLVNKRIEYAKTYNIDEMANNFVKIYESIL